MKPHGSKTQDNIILTAVRTPNLIKLKVVHSLPIIETIIWTRPRYLQEFLIIQLYKQQVVSSNLVPQSRADDDVRGRLKINTEVKFIELHCDIEADLKNAIKWFNKSE
jgi:hypothetical protein